MKAEELSSLLKQMEGCELEAGKHYLVVVDAAAIPVESLQTLGHIFKKQGLVPPIIMRKWGGEFRVLKLEKDE